LPRSEGNGAAVDFRAPVTRCENDVRGTVPATSGHSTASPRGRSVRDISAPQALGPDRQSSPPLPSPRPLFQRTRCRPSGRPSSRPIGRDARSEAVAGAPVWERQAQATARPQGQLVAKPGAVTALTVAGSPCAPAPRSAPRGEAGTKRGNDPLWLHQPLCPEADCFRSANDDVVVDRDGEDLRSRD
jgi:hypothetical protein